MNDEGKIYHVFSLLTETLISVKRVKSEWPVTFLTVVPVFHPNVSWTYGTLICSSEEIAFEELVSGIFRLSANIDALILQGKDKQKFLAANQRLTENFDSGKGECPVCFEEFADREFRYCYQCFGLVCGVCATQLDKKCCLCNKKLNFWAR